MSLSDTQLTMPVMPTSTTGGFGGFGEGSGAWFLVILFLFAFMGNGFGGWGNNAGANDNYVLSSDFATLERIIMDGNNSIDGKLDTQNANICNMNYNQAQLINGIGSQIAQNGYNTMLAMNGIGQQISTNGYETRSAIADVNYNNAMNTNNIQNAIQNGFCQTNYNMATQSCQTLQAIDKVGDRVIDYLANKENQNLRDENFALRLSASQQAQNAYLVNQLGEKAPVPSYYVPNPNFPWWLYRQTAGTTTETTPTA